MSSGRADSEIKLKFTTEHDGAGADAANKKLDDTKRKAAEASGGFGQLGKAATGFKGVMEKVNSAMAGFGVLGLIMQVVNLVKAFDAAKRQQEDLAASIVSGNAEAAVSKLKAGYDSLKESIAAANSETAATRANTDLLLETERRLQDAALTRREEDEVASIDKNDPLLKEKEAAVRARYGQQRADMVGRRGVEDVQGQEARLREDIARRESQIREREQAAAEAEAAASDYSGRAAAATRVSLRETNKSNFLGLKGRDWKFAQREGIEQYAGYAGTLTQQSSAALAVAVQARKDAEAERAAIKADQARLAVLPKVRDAAAAEGSVETSKAARTSASAQDAVAMAAAERERDLRVLEQARRDKAAADARKASLEGGLSSAKDDADKEAREAWVARNMLDTHTANRPSNGGGRKWSDEQRQLQGAWEKEQTEANAVGKTLEALGEATAKDLQIVNAAAQKAVALIKSVEAKLKKDPYGDAGTGG